MIPRRPLGKSLAIQVEEMEREASAERHNAPRVELV
jgi:hypothetical protein